MNHDDAWAKLDEYLEGALAAGARWAVAVHLSDCADCQRYIMQRAQVRDIVRDHAKTIELPPHLDDRLRAALAAEAATSAHMRPLGRSTWTSGGAAALGRFQAQRAVPWRRAMHLQASPLQPGWPSGLQMQLTTSLAWLPPRALRVAAVLGPIAAGMLLLIRALAPMPAMTPDLKTELVVAHALFAQDTSKLDVEGDATTVESWFRDEIGLSVSVPDIDGYRLSGARLNVVDGQPVAQIVYRSIPDGIYLSLLRFKDSGVNLGNTEESDGFAVGQQGPTTFVTWESGGDRTVLIGESPLPVVRGIAGELSGQLGPLPTAAPIEIRVVPSTSAGGRWSDYP